MRVNIIGVKIFGCAGMALIVEGRDLYREAELFGFIFFARYVEVFNHLRRLIVSLRNTVWRDPDPVSLFALEIKSIALTGSAA
ncbi:MAG: hypothetical protein IT544_05120 [Rhodobacteraceae bacterium]|nr:hypothetical protein [Paracoccaceae bacterium]